MSDAPQGKELRAEDLPQHDCGGESFPFITATKVMHQYEDNVERLAAQRLRDYFAARALQGLLAHGWIHRDELCAIVGRDLRLISEQSYAVADAMLEARKGK